MAGPLIEEQIERVTKERESKLGRALTDEEKRGLRWGMEELLKDWEWPNDD